MVKSEAEGEVAVSVVVKEEGGEEEEAEEEEEEEEEIPWSSFINSVKSDIRKGGERVRVAY